MLSFYEHDLFVFCFNAKDLDQIKIVFQQNKIFHFLRYAIDQVKVFIFMLYLFG